MRVGIITPGPRHSPHTNHDARHIYPHIHHTCPLVAAPHGLLDLFVSRRASATRGSTPPSARASTTTRSTPTDCSEPDRHTHGRAPSPSPPTFWTASLVPFNIRDAGAALDRTQHRVQATLGNVYLRVQELPEYLAVSTSASAVGMLFHSPGQGQGQEKGTREDPRRLEYNGT